jgi:hypothetical protein
MKESESELLCTDSTALISTMLLNKIITYTIKRTADDTTLFICMHSVILKKGHFCFI